MVPAWLLFAAARALFLMLCCCVAHGGDALKGGDWDSEDLAQMAAAWLSADPEQHQFSAESQTDGAMTKLFADIIDGHGRQAVEEHLARLATSLSVASNGNQVDQKLIELREMFPGPVQDGDTNSQHPHSTPDVILLNILQGMNPAFRNRVLPNFKSARSLTNKQSVPLSCKSMVDHYCPGALSWLHCLGQHANDLFSSCTDDVKLSVPFACSREITEFCDSSDIGILNCLQDHASNLRQQCLDAVGVTRGVIEHVNAAAVAVQAGKATPTKAQEPQPKPSETVKVVVDWKGPVTKPPIPESRSAGGRLQGAQAVVDWNQFMLLCVFCVVLTISVYLEVTRQVLSKALSLGKSTDAEKLHLKPGLFSELQRPVEDYGSKAL